MYIEKFEVKGLHGFIDAEIDFHQDITVIVGRNGSGKTSILDLISSVLRLDFSALASTQFRSVSVTMQWLKGNRIGIQINRNQRGNMDVSIDQGDGKKYSTSLDSLIRDDLLPDYLAARRGNIQKAMFEDALVSKSFGKIASEIRRDIRLTFVRLDRTILAVDPSGKEALDIASARVGRDAASRNRSPIDDVTAVMREKYYHFKRFVERTRQHTSQELFRLHFSAPDPNLPKRSATLSALRRQLSDLRSRVTNTHFVENSIEISTEINKFFTDFSHLLDEAHEASAASPPRVGRRTLHEETLEVMIRIKEKQINELLKIFNREQQEISGAYERIERYLETVNRFFRDSGKILMFSPEALDFGFKLVAENGGDGKEGAGRTKLRPLKDLSSGERQVLIVLTYLAFLTGDKSIFVIDEPELSLHMKWQKELPKAILDLRPKDCQVIIATHSPEIAGRMKGNAVLLRPSYLGSVSTNQ